MLRGLRLHAQPLGDVGVLPLVGDVGVDGGAAAHVLVGLGQLAQEGVDLVLEVAVALADRTLELLRLLVPVGLLLDLADAEARKGVVTGQGLDLTARDVLHDVARRRVRAGRTADALAPDRLEVLLPVEHEVVEVLLQAAVELRDEVEGGTELGARADEPARRPDQPEQRRRLRERQLQGGFQNSPEGQRLRELHEVGIRLEGPHARELVHLAVAVLHDEAGVTQVPRAGARPRSGLGGYCTLSHLSKPPYWCELRPLPWCPTTIRARTRQPAPGVKATAGPHQVSAIAPAGKRVRRAELQTKAPPGVGRRGRRERGDISRPREISRRSGARFRDVESDRRASFSVNGRLPTRARGRPCP